MESEPTLLVISSCIGPRRDGYAATEKTTAQQAERYHSEQIRMLSETEAISGVGLYTINQAEEAICSAVTPSNN